MLLQSESSAVLESCELDTSTLFEKCDTYAVGAFSESINYYFFFAH